MAYRMEHLYISRFLLNSRTWRWPAISTTESASKRLTIFCHSISVHVIFSSLGFCSFVGAFSKSAFRGPSDLSVVLASLHDLAYKRVTLAKLVYCMTWFTSRVIAWICLTNPTARISQVALPSFGLSASAKLSSACERKPCLRAMLNSIQLNSHALLIIKTQLHITICYSSLVHGCQVCQPKRSSIVLLA